jgi:hypothetical protein
MAAAQRVALQLPPRREAQHRFKKAPISRAEGGQLQAPVGRRPCGWLSNAIELIWNDQCRHHRKVLFIQRDKREITCGYGSRN